MTPSRLPLSVTSPLLAALVLQACAPARMAVPKDVGTASDEIVVTDRSAMTGALADESFRMGTYQVVDVSRKWNSSSGASIGGFASGSTTGGYTFGLKAAGSEYKGKCASKLNEKSAAFLGGSFGKQNVTVLCECGGPASATLSLSADTTSRYRGTLSARNANYTVEGIYTDEAGGSRSTPLGYEVRGGDSVGAVEVAGKGRVWLNKSLDPDARADLACLFAGLLLYQPPQSKFDK
ncbi:MAG: hypothetical protein QOI66_440 [Myxococcales bacterium]|nr:hypothetical protein [Myxococcales bacterium]